MQLDIFQSIYKPLPKVNHLKIGTFFTGIGSPEKALKRIGVDYELKFFSEIDKYAIQSYCAIHNEDVSKNKGDITKIKGKDLPYCDLWFGGFPCQDISLAGKQRGFSKGLDSRSSLGWEMIRLIDEVKDKPKYIIFENVANIMSEPMRPTLNLFKEDLEARGYTLYNEILNAKDYGIPQNRERYFLVAILGDYYFKFPPKQELKLRLKDMLEDEVDEKYYLSDEYMKRFLNSNLVMNNDIKIIGTTVGEEAQGTNSSHWVHDTSGIVGALAARDYKQPKQILIPEATAKGYAEAHDGDRIYLNRPHQKRGVVQKQMIQTLKTSGDDVGVIDNMRIRKLTPCECFYLMGFDDDDCNKASQVCSNSQLYKQAGNSIVVNVLEAIFKNLIGE